MRHGSVFRHLPILCVAESERPLNGGRGSLGSKEVDSEHLTTFRNQAMMKAVKRIRSFGYDELTFEAFDTAMEKTKRCRGMSRRKSASRKFAGILPIRTEETGRRDTGRRLMDRFRSYLKGKVHSDSPKLLVRQFQRILRGNLTNWIGASLQWASACWGQNLCRI